MAHRLSSSSGAYNVDHDQTSAFFIGVILGTALVVQKCQALIGATKASCVFVTVHVLFIHLSYLYCCRLEERGWIVSGTGARHSSSSSREDASGMGSSASVVVVKTGKKKIDYERYLDATQRYVRPHLFVGYILFYSSFSRALCCL